LWGSYHFLINFFLSSQLVEILITSSFFLSSWYAWSSKSCLIYVQYARANAVEAKNNLFGVLFDYVLHKHKNKCLASGTPLPSYDEIQAVATVLALADAPVAFAVALKLGLLDVGEELKNLIVKAMSRDVNSGRLNTEV
jgi:hypothetical protein